AWRWIFWINIPVGVLGLVLATLYIPDLRGEVREPFDFRGFVLSGLGLALFMTGSTTLGLALLPRPLVLTMFFAGAALLLLYVFHSRRAKSPIVDLTLFSIPTFSYSMIGALLVRLGVGATPFLLPLLLQVGFGLTPFHSGLITFASAVGAIAMKFVAPPLLRRHGFRTILVLNAVVASAFVAMPAT